jgi:hypothetical protein
MAAVCRILIQRISSSLKRSLHQDSCLIGFSSYTARDNGVKNTKNLWECTQIFRLLISLRWLIYYAGIISRQTFRELFLHLVSTVRLIGTGLLVRKPNEYARRAAASWMMRADAPQPTTAPIFHLSSKNCWSCLAFSDPAGSRSKTSSLSMWLRDIPQVTTLPSSRTKKRRWGFDA